MDNMVRSPCINWNNYKNVFDIFRDTEIKIISIEETGSYTKTRTIKELCNITASIEPYNGGLAAKEYGLEKECQKRMFCEHNGYLTEGNYAEIGGQRYRIIYVEDWDSGATALLQAVRV